MIGTGGVLTTLLSRCSRFSKNVKIRLLTDSPKGVLLEALTTLFWWAGIRK
jgi:hypothetical protein